MINQTISMQIKKSLSSDVAISFGARILAYAFSFGISLVISRFYGADILGLYAFVLSVQALLAIFFSLGSDLGTVKYVSHHEALSNKAEVELWVVTAHQLRVIMAGLGTLLFIFILVQYFQKENIAINFSGTIALGLTLYLLLLRNLYMNVARGAGKVSQTFVFNEFTLNLTRFLLIIVIALVATAPGFLHVIVVHLLSITLSLFLMRLLVKNYHFSGKWSNFKKRHSDLLQFSTPFLLQNAAWLTMSFTSTIVIGVFSTAENVAGYDVSFKLAMVTALILNVVNAVFAPKFSQLYAKSNINELQRLTKTLSRVLFFLSLPVLVSYWALGESVLGLWGEGFVKFYWVLLILSAGQFFNVSTGSVGMLLTMTNYVHLAKKIALIASLLNIGLNIVLVSKYGPLGAAVATSLSLIFMNSAYLVAVKKKLGFYTF